jgi:hypothetical protein
MTRKDYIILANTLRIAHNNAVLTKSQEAVWTVEQLASDLCCELKRDNARFNREHFLAVVSGKKDVNSRPSKKRARQTVSCDQCQMLSINHVACHETGCPNAKKTWAADRKEWILFVECRECGCQVEDGTCNCHEANSAVQS